MDLQLAFSLLLVAASVVFLVLRVVQTVRRRSVHRSESAAPSANGKREAPKPRPLRRL